MNKKSRLFAAAIFATSLVPNVALAAMLATAVTDLNIRSGPGPEYTIIGFIQAQDPVTMIGCIEGSLWCQVTHKGKEGWAYSQSCNRVGGEPCDYLRTSTGDDCPDRDVYQYIGRNSCRWRGHRCARCRSRRCCSRGRCRGRARSSPTG